MPPQFRGRSGPVRLGRKLGRGGEGSVYEVANRPDLVAKVYHEPISGEKAAKIEAMASIKTDRLLSLTAWPLEVLSTLSGNPCGLLMPRICNHRDIHTLYSPRSRKTEFPHANWGFLLRAACNTARAFAVIHDAGCVIGDVNHGGITVSNKATVKLIDCDSFQVTNGVRKFLCEVGVPTFTPPELQGKNFRGLVRTANHDNFGLAVMIFLLLFMGRHPFAGRFLGRGDMGIEQAIMEFRFAYGSHRAAVQMEPPPNVPMITVASDPVALLLEKAFSREGAKGPRPTANEWVTALKGLEKRLKQCYVNTSHLYLNGLLSCPWCHLEAATGVVLFNLHIDHGSGGTPTFDIAAVWAAITAVHAPGPTPELLTRQHFGTIKPSQEAVAAGGNKFARGLAIVVVVAATIGLCIVLPQAFIFWLTGGFFVGKTLSAKKTNTPEIIAFASRYRTAEAQYHAIKDYWDRETSDAKFTAKIRELTGYKDTWGNIRNVRECRYRQLEQQREKQQLRRFLEQFTIEHASISGIGPGRKAMLESYNVETAWDISDGMRVPGFGPALTRKLLEWRRSVERKFRFDPTKEVDPRDIVALDREMTDERRKLERHLTTGVAELTQIGIQIVGQRKALLPQVNDAYEAMLRAEADMNAAKA